VDALCSEGFRVAQRCRGSTTLSRGPHVIIVPDVLMLPCPVLDAILSEADVTYSRLFALLGEEPTSTEVVFDK